MRKSLRKKLYLAVGSLAVLLIFAGIGQLMAQQTKITVKPPKPPEVTCDGDLICVNGEYANTLPHDLQPCLDCQPKPYGNLVITQDPGVQIFGKWAENGKLFQYKFEGGVYKDTWSSVELADYINERDHFFYNLGDPDHDGQKEIVIIKNYLVKEESTGKGKNKVVIKYYEQEASIFETGSDGNPTYTTQRFGNSEGLSAGAYMADANNDGFKDELILNKHRSDGSSYIQIFRLNLSDNVFEEKWTSPNFDGPNLQPVGDADGDGYNEIVLRDFFGAYAVIIENLTPGTDTWGEIRYSDPIPDCRLDKVLAVEADNYTTPDPEIIGGGNTGQLAVWKLIGDQYKLVFLSEPMGVIGEGYIGDIEVGDVDDDPQKEVIFSYYEYGSNYLPVYYVCELVWTGPDPDSYKLIIESTTVLGHPGTDFAIGDIDGDGKDEIVQSGDGGTIYKYDNENECLSELYNALFLGTSVIK